MGRVLFTITKDRESAAVKTTNDPAVYLTEKEYTEEEYAVIRGEAELWNVEHVHSDGYDYGYDQSSCNRYTEYNKITDEMIVVENGRFVGIMLKSSGHAFNKETTVYNDLRIAFTRDYKDKKAVLCARTGESFSSDDHESWDLDYYYLRKKEDNEPNAG